MMATNTREDDVDAVEFLYKQWLPLKLDETASSHLESIEVDEWPEIKEQLSELLIDPHERMRWRARQTTIKWDGKESLHTLATRIVRAVDTYDSHLPADVRNYEYFTRFRAAFKKTLMRVIDMNCPEGAQTIEEAKKAVMRYQLASANDEEADSGDPYKAVAFAAVHLHPDRASGLESSIAALGTKIEDLAISIRSVDQRLKVVEDTVRSDGRRYDGPRSDNTVRFGDRRPNNSWNGGGNRFRNQSPRGYSPARPRGNFNDRSYDNRGRDDGGRNSRGWNRGGNRDYSGDRRGPRSDSRSRDYSTGRRDNSGYRNDRRGDPDYSRDDRQGSRRDDRGQGPRSDSRRDERGRDNYRAIETGDEYSSYGSEDDDKTQSPSRPTASVQREDDEQRPGRSARREN